MMAAMLPTSVYDYQLTKTLDTPSVSVWGAKCKASESPEYYKWLGDCNDNRSWFQFKADYKRSHPSLITRISRRFFFLRVPTNKGDGPQCIFRVNITLPKAHYGSKKQTPWFGEGSEKLFMQSGCFSSTLKAHVLEADIDKSIEHANSVLQEHIARRVEQEAMAVYRKESYLVNMYNSYKNDQAALAHNPLYMVDWDKADTFKKDCQDLVKFKKFPSPGKVYGGPEEYKAKYYGEPSIGS